MASAYLNRWGHITVGLGCLSEEFLDRSRLYLICATHSALNHSATDTGLGGRCHGRGLAPLPVVEEADGVYLMEER